MRRRTADIKRSGCIPCILSNGFFRMPEEHHIVEQAYRTPGHDNTYGACPWHHRGVVGLDLGNMTAGQMTEWIGPSLRLNAKAYHERFGSEQTILKTQNYVLDLFEKEPWADYDMPRTVAKRIRAFWTDAKKCESKPSRPSE